MGVYGEGGGKGDGPEDAIAVLRAVDSLDAHGGILLPGIGDIDADRLCMWLAGFADDNLDDFPVLAKVLVAAQGFEQSVFLHLWAEAGHIDQVLLNDTQASEVFSAEGVCLTLLGFLLGGDGILLLLGGLS